MDKKLLTALCIAALVGCGCKPKTDDSIRVEKVPKETVTPLVANSDLPAGHPAITDSTAAPSMAGPGSMGALPGMAEFTAATPTPKWTPPTDWAAEALTTTRKGSWRVPASAAADQQAEISVSVFQGQLGGLLANVNRWRGKVGLTADLPEERLSENVQNLTLNGRAAQLVSLDGPAGQSLEGVLVFMPDKVWSLLMSGPTDTIKSQRAEFRAFLDSIQWQD
ncbi:MAG TPA: hypothetical protein VK737_11660 [Opitutales bacterium]|nr:hypothetical protein [Opitutales bacterium]